MAKFFPLFSFLKKDIKVCVCVGGGGVGGIIQGFYLEAQNMQDKYQGINILLLCLVMVVIAREATT